jgi:hypothetical protein
MLELAEISVSHCIVSVSYRHHSFSLDFMSLVYLLAQDLVPHHLHVRACRRNQLGSYLTQDRCVPVWSYQATYAPGQHVR